MRILVFQTFDGDIASAQNSRGSTSIHVLYQDHCKTYQILLKDIRFHDQQCLNGKPEELFNFSFKILEFLKQSDFFLGQNMFKLIYYNHQ